MENFKVVPDNKPKPNKQWTQKRTVPNQKSSKYQKIFENQGKTFKKPIQSYYKKSENKSQHISVDENCS